MIIPLGLGQKLYKTPLVTLTLGLLTVLCFFLQADLSLLYTNLAELRRELHLKEKAVAYFTSYCHRRVNPDKLCAKYAPLVERLYPEPASHRGMPPTRKEQEALQKAAYDRYLELEGLRQELLTAKRGQRLYKMSQVVANFYHLRHHLKPTPSLLKLPGADAYQTALVNFQERAAKAQLRYGMLSRHTASLETLVVAQFTHGNFMHLLGNLLMFLIFGIYVEQRVRASLYTLFYLGGGALALYLQLLSFPDPSLSLLGASASVSVVLGLFYSLFFHADMRLHIPFLTNGRRIYMPIRWALPILYVVADVSEAITQSPALQGGGGVAHMAHLYGFGLGLLGGFALRLLNPLPHSFIYPQELASLQELARPTHSPHNVRLLATKHLACNPHNLPVRWHAVDCLTHAPLGKDEQAFLVAQMPMLCVGAIKAGSAQALVSFLAGLPLQVAFPLVLARLGQKRCLQLAELALTRSLPLLALRLFDSYLINYPGSRQAPLVRLSARSLLGNWPQELGASQLFAAYLQLNPGSALAYELHHVLAQPAEVSTQEASYAHAS